MDRQFESTARMALWRMLKIANIFTLEASFYGHNLYGRSTHYSPKSYKEIGKSVCLTLFKFQFGDLFGESDNLRK